VKIFFNVIANSKEHVDKLLLSADAIDIDRSLFRIFLNDIDNKYDPYLTISNVLSNSKNDFEIFLHQDVRFNKPYDLKCLEQQLSCLSKDTGIVGLAGFDNRSNWITYVRDPTNSPISQISNISMDVIHLDECFLCISVRNMVSTTTSLSGFHCYANDLLLNAKRKHIRTCIIPFEVSHLSSGNFDSGYFHSLSLFEKYLSKYFIGYTGGYCILAPSPVIRRLLNRKLVRSIFFAVTRQWLLRIRK
jgi:hypothetical protein